MAKLLMGAIVTRAVGKIGGHAFRLRGTTQILQRTAFSRKRNVSVTNKAMPVIKQVFKSWNTINAASKNAWKALAQNVIVIDRFGNPTGITGRGLFSKSNISAILADFPAVDPLTWNGTVPTLETSGVTISVGADKIILEDLQMSGADHFIFGIKRVANDNVFLQASQIPTLLTMPRADYTAADLYSAVVGLDYILIIGQRHCIKIQAVTSSGVASPALIFNTIVGA